jgi:hypothetical protein
MRAEGVPVGRTFATVFRKRASAALREAGCKIIHIRKCSNPGNVAARLVHHYQNTNNGNCDKIGSELSKMLKPLWFDAESNEDKQNNIKKLICGSFHFNLYNKRIIRILIQRLLNTMEQANDINIVMEENTAVIQLSGTFSDDESDSTDNDTD